MNSRRQAMQKAWILGARLARIAPWLSGALRFLSRRQTALYLAPSSPRKGRQARLFASHRDFQDAPRRFREDESIFWIASMSKPVTASPP